MIYRADNKTWIGRSLVHDEKYRFNCFLFFWFPTRCPEPTLELRLNPDRALQGPFGGGAPNKIFSIPRARTRDLWLRVKHSHQCTTTHVGQANYIIK
uniref:Putative ovule protein n=1 Tax=Solanum chacoense TaxID=4108 RepID=A0A0V0H455_SOLCH